VGSYGGGCEVYRFLGCDVDGAEEFYWRLGGTSLNFYQFIRRHIPEDITLHSNRVLPLKPQNGSTNYFQNYK
jgi:hypothetical protein